MERLEVKARPITTRYDPFESEHRRREWFWGKEEEEKKKTADDSEHHGGEYWVTGPNMPLITEKRKIGGEDRIGCLL